MLIEPVSVIGSANIDSAMSHEQRLAIKHMQRGGFEIQWMDHRDSHICMSRNINGNISVVYVKPDGDLFINTE